MSREVAIRVDGLGKQFRYGASSGPYRTLRETLAGMARPPWRRPREASVGRGTEVFWALRDLSFEIGRGEVVGVVGRNGAGKSTLLKILSRITGPSAGWIDLYGRVGSLLEVGTGFHPELSGRENVYLNGAILGMSRGEIGRKFDEIVAFAEVEKFVDTAVKHYSSGMYLRLAFAVAAHLDPEILVLDEVLAVGDVVFQQKCLGKMGEVSRQGGTVLFVSHNMGAVASLTTRCLLLEGGRLQADGPTDQVLARYLRDDRGGCRTWAAREAHDLPMQIFRVEARADDPAERGGAFDVREPVTIAIDYEVRRAVQGAVIAVNVHAADGAHLLSLEDTDGGRDLLRVRDVGRYRTELTIPGQWLNGGQYHVRVGCGVPKRQRYENIEALTIELVETGDHEARAHRGGYLLPMLPWRTRAIAASSESIPSALAAEGVPA